MKVIFHGVIAAGILAVSSLAFGSSIYNCKVSVLPSEQIVSQFKIDTAISSTISADGNPNDGSIYVSCKSFNANEAQRLTCSYMSDFQQSGVLATAEIDAKAGFLGLSHYDGIVATNLVCIK